MNFFLILLATIACACSCPNGIIEYGVNRTQIQVILQYHNLIRDLVSAGKVENQPKASNMNHLKYDRTLAKQAQRLANSCVFDHDNPEDGRWDFVGQNLYIYYSTRKERGSDWESAIQYWFEEHELYTFSASFNYAAAHYTQLIWAETEVVGCGYSFYEEDGTFRKLYVCNYGPGGNVFGQTPYAAEAGV